MSEQIRCEDNCLECKVYNHEKFYCPKWCSVIKNTITDARTDAIDECIEIVKNSYRMDALEKLQNLKQNLIE